MARQRGIIKLQGTIAGLSFVRSAAYGDHVRATRGSYKKAKINEVLKANSVNAKPVTRLASPVLRLLKTLAPGFVAGDLWSRMMGVMYSAKSSSVADLLEGIKGIELNEKYSFARLFADLPKLQFAKRKNKLFAGMEVPSHAQFAKEVNPREYLVEVSLLFYSGKGIWTMDTVETEWISFDEGTGVYEMEFPIPKGANYFLSVMGVKGGSDGKAIESFAARGYCINGWGKC